MDKELQTMGQNIPQKELLVNFVQDVADMEARAFSMREAAERCKHNANWQLDRAQKDRDEKRKWFESAKEYHMAMASRSVHVPELKKRKLFDPLVKVWKRSDGSLNWAFIISVAMIPYILIFIAVYCLLIDPFIIPTENNKRRKEYEQRLQEEKDKYNCNIAKCYAIMIEREKEFKEAQSQLEKEKENARIISEQANDLLWSANTVQDSILRCYQMNIIKPAYQNMVCVTILNEIFQNDKADTMREAMLLCDQAIRHEEIIGRLDNIVYALESIAHQMSGINATLDSINFNISMISQDIYKIVENQERMMEQNAEVQARNEAMQARIAYATESIKQSSDNADFYIAQRRAGIL